MLKKLSHTLLASLAIFALAAHAQPSPPPGDVRHRSADSVDSSNQNIAQTPKNQTQSTSTPASTSSVSQTDVALSKAVVAKPDGWQLFTPPAGDFQIVMPANVQRKVDNQPGKSSTQFFQRADGIDFLVTDGAYISSARRESALQGFYLEAVDKIEKQLNKTNATLVTREVKEISGKGWHGKQVLFKTGDKVLATIRIVFSINDDVGYKLLASSGMENQRVQIFFDSFEVNPAIASKAHLGSASSATVRNFVAVIWPISLLVLGAVVVSLIVSGFRHRKG